MLHTIVARGIKLLRKFKIFLLKIAAFSSITGVWKSCFPVKHCNRTSDKLPFLNLYNVILYVNKEEGRKSKICVGSLITCCRPNCNVTFSIIFPLKLRLSFLYQFFDFTLKSPISTTKRGLFWSNLSNFNLSFSENLSNSYCDWLGDLYRPII